MIHAARIRLLTACLALMAAGGARGATTTCWVDHGAVVVAAAYGPIAGDFILDLSQAHSQLHATSAQMVGWTKDQARWSLRLGGRTRPGFPMSIADLGARTAAFPTNISGVLGADAVRDATLELSLDPCRLTLTRGRAGARSRALGLRFRTIAGVPAVYAAISDGVSSRAGWFAIDTASQGSRIADAGFSRALPAGADPADRARPPARLRAISLGGVLIEQTPAGVMEAAPPGLAGALGLAVWGKVRLHVKPRRAGGTDR